MIVREVPVVIGPFNVFKMAVRNVHAVCFLIRNGTKDAAFQSDEVIQRVLHAGKPPFFKKVFRHIVCKSSILVNESPGGGTVCNAEVRVLHIDVVQGALTAVEREIVPT